MTVEEPFVAPSGQAVVEVTGEDRAGYLEDVTTQHLADVEPGQVRGALHLGAHGSPLAMFDVVALPGRLLLVVADEDQADAVVDDLGSKTFLRDATFAHTDLAVRAVRGEGAGEVCAAAEIDGAELAGEAGRSRGGDEDDGAGSGPVVVGREGGLDLLAEPDVLDEVVDRLLANGAGEATGEDLEAWRIRAGVPAWGSEVTAPHLPEEMGLLPTHVHLDKGCFPGQEAIARMWNLGQPRRRLARVRMSPPVDAGETLGSGRDKVRVTSVVPARDAGGVVPARDAGEGVPDNGAAGSRSADGAGGETGDGDAPAGAVDALAFVPADSDAGDELVADEVEVEVLGIVGAGRPIPGRDPTRTRRRDED